MDGRPYIRRLGLILLAAVLGLAACKSDNATRSPDLPAPKINSISVTCTNTTLFVGQTTNCTAECTYTVVNSSGQQIITAPQTCQNLVWSSSNPSQATVNQNGLVTAIAPGSPNITGSADGLSDSDVLTIQAATVVCSIVYQPGVVPDPVPDSDCLPSTNFMASAPVGIDIPFRAAVFLNSGQVCYAPNAPANQQACPADLVVTFTSSSVATASFASPASGVARTNAIGTTEIRSTGSTNRVDLTVTAAVLNAQLCVQAATNTPGCTNLTAADTFATACPATAVPNIATGGNPFQFRARALFDLGTAVAKICDVTVDPETTWTIADVGSNAAANPTVNNTGIQKGQVSAGTAATTGATVQAIFDPAPAGPPSATGTHDFNVILNTVIASNSLVASVVPFGANPDDPNYATRAACVGSFDLVDGLAEPPGLPAQDRLYAVLRRCQGGTAGAECPANLLSDTPEDVTNAEPADLGTIVWTKEIGYWDGIQCVQPPDPTGLATVVGDVGDLDADLPPPSRYAVGAAFTGMGDGRIFNKAAATPRDNGVAVSNGGLSLGTVCITATYAEGGASTTDGITMIVLPVTNDSLLTDPDAGTAVDLCNTLVPLFVLGSSPDGANGLVIQALGAVSNILNPLLTGLDAGLDTEGLLTGVITALNPITGTLSDAVLTPILVAANDGLYTPINCLLNSVLLALNPNAPPAQACP